MILQRKVVGVSALLVFTLVLGAVLLASFASWSPFSVLKASHAASSCGVVKTSQGYTFSPLHVAHGVLLSDTNCTVTLRGFNWAQIEYGNAVGGGRTTRISEQAMAWYTQTFHTNVWRIPLNSYWWNTNVDVPLAKMRYQDWIQQIVRWSEMNGDYIILTKGPQFHAPPCGGQVKLCPSQNYGSKENDPTHTTSGMYISDAVTMWTSIASLYKNDPAVLYDSWNEMHDLSAQVWQQQENKLIAAIRGQNANSVVFLGGANYKSNINALVQNQVSDFTQPNLVYDFHVYDGFKGTYMGKRCDSPKSYLWQNWPHNADQQVQFAQQHDKAVSISEWGGCNDLEQYNQALTSYSRQNHISMVYYDETNVATMSNGHYRLTTNGVKVRAAYATFSV